MPVAGRAALERASRGNADERTNLSMPVFGRATLKPDCGLRNPEPPTTCPALLRGAALQLNASDSTPNLDIIFNARFRTGRVETSLAGSHTSPSPALTALLMGAALKLAAQGFGDPVVRELTMPPFGRATLKWGDARVKDGRAHRPLNARLRTGRVGTSAA